MVVGDHTKHNCVTPIDVPMAGPMYRCEKNITDSRFTPLSGGPELTPLLLTTRVDGRTNSIRGGSVRPVYADDGTNPYARLPAAVLPIPVSYPRRLHRNRLLTCNSIFIFGDEFDVYIIREGNTTTTTTNRLISRVR